MADEGMSMPARFNFVAGQVIALKCVVAAFATLLKANPAALEEFEAATQLTLTNLEKTRASDDAFDGFQDVVKPLRKILGGQNE